MIQQTLDRLLLVGEAGDVWVMTNGLLRETIGEQLPQVPSAQLLCEPTARNTAPACALAAFLLEKSAPQLASQTVIGIFPSDHIVKNPARFAEVVRAGAELAAGGERIVVLGVPPTRPETGYGYIEQGGDVTGAGKIPARRVKRFTEKPDLATAEEFLATGNYAWNAGIFLWSARTLTRAIREHCPAMAPLLEEIAAAWGTAEFERVFCEVYPRCESISIDYAVLEPRSGKGELLSEIYCLPADFEWTDIGSWAALHEHQVELPELTGCGGANVVDAGKSLALESHRNYVFAPGKAVVLLGVSDLVVVETEDSLLITTRDRSQDVGNVVKALAADGREELL